MTAPTTTPSDDELYRLLARLHGHRCPMSILGARLGLAARARLPDPAQSGLHLAARYFHSTCALDGIQLTTGCTLGNRNIEARPAHAEHRLEVWVQETRQCVAVRLTEEALAMGHGYGELRRLCQAESPESPPRARLEEQMEELLRKLEAAPEATIVFVEAPVPGETA